MALTKIDISSSNKFDILFLFFGAVITEKLIQENVNLFPVCVIIIQKSKKKTRYNSIFKVSTKSPV